MAKRWTLEEETHYRRELSDLYVRENKSIREIGTILRIKEGTVYDRLKRLGISTAPHLKEKYLNRRREVLIPEYSEDLAEFFGIMLGDGHISHFQVIVTLGTKEYEYVRYVQALMSRLFGIDATICEKRSGYRDVYIGSVAITSWLAEQGLVTNKVAAQVGVPAWIFTKSEYMRRFVRGFFDTDGSIYQLRFGIQISITNHSIPLLTALQDMLRRLGYSVSKVSSAKIYITRRQDVVMFFNDIEPQNTKHLLRFDKFMRRWRSGKRTRL